MRYLLPKVGTILTTVALITVAVIVADLNEMRYSLFFFYASPVAVVVLWASHVWEDYVNSELNRFEKKIDALHDKLLEIEFKLESLDSKSD